MDNFQRNARGGHLVFQNEAYFSPREAYPAMKKSCKFGEPSWCSFPLKVLTPKISIAKVNKLDTGTPSCTQPPKPFLIVSMQYSQH